jgi:hypothetical protein
MISYNAFASHLRCWLAPDFQREGVQESRPFQRFLRRQPFRIRLRGSCFARAQNLDTGGDPDAPLAKAMLCHNTLPSRGRLIKTVKLMGRY